jgi:hypothetical protein
MRSSFVSARLVDQRVRAQAGHSLAPLTLEADRDTE